MNGPVLEPRVAVGVEKRNIPLELHIETRRRLIRRRLVVAEEDLEISDPRQRSIPNGVVLDGMTHYDG